MDALDNLTAAPPDGQPRPRDEGSVLTLALALIVVCSLLVLPMLGYATTVAMSSKVVVAKAVRVEAVKGGLRTALADPVALYKTCDSAGMTVGVNLASPALNTDVSTKCYKMEETSAEDPTSIRFGVATVQVGSSVPTGVAGEIYPGSGASPEGAWLNDTTALPTTSKIWLPLLPAHGLNQRSITGYDMPAGYPTCKVYFPGTYQDDLVITGSTPVFFTSGIYYFEKSVRFSGDANVVVGGGATQGCTTDQEAAFYATNAPTSHNISGLGATFVFGDAGRLVVDTATAGSSMSVVFNLRYVGATDESTVSSAGVSIMTVNGALSGTDGTDLVVPGVLQVPLSYVAGSPAVAATTQEYKPSTLIPTAVAPPPDTTTTTTVVGTTTTTVAPAPTPVTPVIDVQMTTAATVKLSIPGYIAVPQGLITINTTTGAEVNKDISIAGGMLAAAIDITGPRSALFNVGLVNPVVQKIFKIVSTTTSGLPVVVSNAIVQVNQNGAYAINSWAVQ